MNPIPNRASLDGLPATACLVILWSTIRQLSPPVERSRSFLRSTHSAKWTCTRFHMDYRQHNRFSPLISHTISYAALYVFKPTSTTIAIIKRLKILPVCLCFLCLFQYPSELYPFQLFNPAWVRPRRLSSRRPVDLKARWCVMVPLTK